MNNIIDVKKLSFSYDKKKVLKNIDFSLCEGQWLTIVGPNGSGKSTLARLLVDTYPYNGTITINGDDNKIGIVYATSDLQFVVDTVDEEISLSQKNLKLSMEEFRLRKNKIISALNLTKILELKPSKLSNSYKVLVSLASVLIYEPSILILDGTLDVLDNVQRERVIKVLNSIYKKGTTIINITQNIDNSLLGDKIMLLYDGEIKIYDTKESFFEREKELKKYGIKLPFVIDLSLKLKYYNMIDKLYFNMEELVDAIWK